MNSPDQDSRINLALQSTQPAVALFELARAFREEGMSQEEMKSLFDRYRALHAHDADESHYDAILDTMDYICGWCLPSVRLFGDHES